MPKCQGVSLVSVLGVVYMAQSIQGSSPIHTPFTSSSLFFMVVKMTPLIAFVCPFVWGWATVLDTTQICMCSPFNWGVVIHDQGVQDPKLTS